MSTYPPPPSDDDRPGQPAWAPPEDDGYGGPPKSNGLAIAALVCGIIALLASWIPVVNLLSVVLGIAAIILGVMGLRKADVRGGRGIAIGGIVTGILGLLAAIILLVFAVSVFQQAVNDPEVQDLLESELERQEQLQQDLETDGG